MWSTFGDYLESSGWAAALIQAGVASPGTAESYLRASHLTGTRYAQQVSALALAKLQEIAYMSTDRLVSQEAWRETMKLDRPMFHYWDTILNLELGHIERKISHSILTLSRTLYLGFWPWITLTMLGGSLYTLDMENLPTSIHNEFHEHGHWVVQKTNNLFSAMPIDQAHEQNNSLVKGLVVQYASHKILQH